MGLYKLTTKDKRRVNGVQIEKGMTVEVVFHSDPIGTSEGKKAVGDAFQRKYGIDVDKASIISRTYLEIEKLS